MTRVGQVILILGRPFSKLQSELDLFPLDIDIDETEWREEEEYTLLSVYLKIAKGRKKEIMK